MGGETLRFAFSAFWVTFSTVGWDELTYRGGIMCQNLPALAQLSDFAEKVYYLRRL